MAKSTEKPQVAASSVISLPQPPVRNAQEYLKAYTGYAYTAISAIAQDLASIDIHLYKAKFMKSGKVETTEVFSHPALSLLRYCNTLSTFYDMLEATQIYLELVGEAYWLVLKQGKTPQELWLLRPDWIKVIPDEKDVIKGYSYHPGGSATESVFIPRENIVPFKLFNPVNPYRGRGVLQAAALPYDIHNFMQEYNRNFFFNSAIPNMVFTAEGKISDATVKRFLNQWQASFGGRAKSNKIAFIGNGMKLDKTTMGAKELDFSEQQKIMRDDILAVFKVPKTVLGLTEDVNRANADSTTRAFMERVITPRMRKLVETLNEFYMPMFGDDALFLDFTDPAPEDVELKLKRYENGRKYGWLTPNEVRVEENLEPVEGGDELGPLLAPKEEVDEDDEDDASDDTEGEKPNDDADDDNKKPTDDDADDEDKGVMAIVARLLGRKKKKKKYRPKLYRRPVKHMVRLPMKSVKRLQREALKEQFVPVVTEFIGRLLKDDSNHFSEEEKNTKKKEDAKEPVHLSEEEKQKVWEAFIENVTNREAEIKGFAVDIFREQEYQVLQNLENDVKHWKKEVRKGKEASVIPSLEQLSLMWAVLEQVLREIYVEQGNYTLDYLGTGGAIDLTTAFAVQYLQEYAGTLITGINTTTREKLRETLAEGFEAGEDIGKLKKRVKTVFADATTNRAEMIARTEALRASNAATVEAYRQSGVVESKEWLTERDGRACPFCLDQDGKTVKLSTNFFKEGETIEVNGEKYTVTLAVGEPPLHPRCRCTTIPVLIGK